MNETRRRSWKANEKAAMETGLVTADQNRKISRSGESGDRWAEAVLYQTVISSTLKSTERDISPLRCGFDSRSRTSRFGSHPRPSPP